MIDVDDDAFKSITASRLNKAYGLIKGRAAPCNWLFLKKYLPPNIASTYNDKNC